MLTPLAKCGAECARISPLGPWANAAIAAGTLAVGAATLFAIFAMHDGAQLRHAALHWLVGSASCGRCKLRRGRRSFDREFSAAAAGADSRPVSLSIRRERP